jgi:hypothetical protein
MLLDGLERGEAGCHTAAGTTSIHLPKWIAAAPVIDGIPLTWNRCRAIVLHRSGHESADGPVASRRHQNVGGNNVSIAPFLNSRPIYRESEATLSHRKGRDLRAIEAIAQVTTPQRRSVFAVVVFACAFAVGTSGPAAAAKWKRSQPSRSARTPVGAAGDGTGQELRTSTLLSQGEGGEVRSKDCFVVKKQALVPGMGYMIRRTTFCNWGLRNELTGFKPMLDILLAFEYSEYT